jgi:predicted Zn-dependent protease
MLRHSLRHCLILLLLTVITASQINGCATNPVSGTPEVVFMTEAKEIELGRTNDVKVRNQYGVYDNPELQAYVQRVGQKLAAQSHRPGLGYQFTVLDSPEVNAFALPGGYIYITRGILAYINSEAELAAVLGHEIGHVTARHSVRQYTATMATGVVGAIIGAATGVRGTQDLFNVLGNAFLSGYGRDHELESDRLGAEYLARAGYDPQAIIQVIGILKNQEEFEKQRAAAENRAPRIYHGVFASHPSADRRLQEVVAEADKFKTGAMPTIARDEYLNRVDNLVYGDNAKDGVRYGNSFYHRGMNFALDFPTGWQVENTPQAIRAGNSDKTALLIVQAETSTKELPPHDFLNLRMNFVTLDQAGPVEGIAFPSYTGIAAATPAFGKRRARVATLYFNDRRFLFQGATKDASTFAAADPLIMSAIRSLRPLNDKEKKLAEGMRVHMVRARPGDTFASLAKKSPFTNYSESTLRLINDKYPDGEPRAGELIKIIQ